MTEGARAAPTPVRLAGRGLRQLRQQAAVRRPSTPQALRAYVDHGFADTRGRQGEAEVPGPSSRPQSIEMGARRRRLRPPRSGDAARARGRRDHAERVRPAVHVAEQVADALPNGSSRGVPSLGHFGPLQDPGLIATEVDDFLSGLSEAGGPAPHVPHGSANCPRTPLLRSGPWRSRSPRACRPRRCPPSPTALSRSGSPRSTACPSPAAPTSKGSLVHRALERLFASRPRSAPGCRPLAALDQAIDALRRARARPAPARRRGPSRLLRRGRRPGRALLHLEDPRAVRPIGIELRLEVEVGGLQLRGIIDRFELDDEGELVVTDYKTGRVPHQDHEQGNAWVASTSTPTCASGSSAAGRPAVQLLYLATGEVIITPPSEQSVRFLPSHRTAVYRRSSGPAPPRTSGPTPARSATGARSRRGAPRSAAIRQPAAAVDLLASTG